MKLKIKNPCWNSGFHGMDFMKGYTFLKSILRKALLRTYSYISKLAYFDFLEN